jgi:D-alanyl-lipoteichoic acid acyltransferase DltB (MBOAT superfamily)
MSDQAVQTSTDGGPVAAARRPWSVGALDSLLVLLGAALCFVALCADYYGADGARQLGWKQLTGLVVGAAAMLAGAALSVWTGRRTLAETASFWMIAGQVALLVGVLYVYDIEARVFRSVIAPLVLFGFIANHYAPAGQRLALFFLLGLASVVAALGIADPAAAAWLLGAALALIGVCHLPAPLWARVGLLAIAAVGLGAVRIGVIETSWGSIVVPLLASMFMFRLAIYLYDLRTGKAPKSVWARLSYFFTPPNPVFPFFPVVDCATFGRSHYNEDACRIYQRGAQWMLRGVVHLLIYRVIYMHLQIAPENVSSPLELLQHVTTNFGLYFRISGLFHLITGMLLLFGFNLPETHSRFYFSSSFTEVWRRMNIYWKDFMQKMFFNPSFTRLKRLGASHQAAILGAIAIVFTSTWALHSYQWFWLRGSVFLDLPDMLFWVVFGAFLAIQTSLEPARTARRGSGGRERLLGPGLSRVVRTVCTMLVLCVMWSLWTSDSLLGWVDLLAASGVAPALGAPSAAGVADWLVTLASLAVMVFAVAVAMGLSLGLLHAGEPQRRRVAPSDPRRSALGAAAIGVVLASLLAVQAPGVQPLLGIEGRSLLESISATRLNRQDQALQRRGYYEELTDLNQLSPELWAVLAARPNAIGTSADNPTMRFIDDYLAREYAPLAQGIFNGVTNTINRWGMRDDDVERAKPANTVRIALVGASRSVGWGVEHDVVFEARLEEALNAASRERGGPRYEVLNFSVDGYQPVQRLLLLERKVWDFEPDAVIFTGQRADKDIDHIAEMFVRGRPAPYDFVETALARAEIEPSMELSRIKSRLAPFGEEIMAAVYRRVAELCAENGAAALWMYIPSLAGLEAEPRVRAEQVAEAAREAGFMSLETERMYDGLEVEAIEQGPWDGAHPNAHGHQVIADLLLERLVALETEGAIELGLVD